MPSRQAPFVFGLEQRKQRLQRLLRVADEIDLHRIAQRQHVGGDVDLDAARLALLGQELRVGEARADHQERVAFGHQLVARLGAEEADRARHAGQVVGQRRLAEQRLRDAGAQRLRDGDHLVGRVERACADQDRDLPAGVEDVGGALEVGVERHGPRGREADAGMHRAVLARRVLVRLVLEVVREDDRRHAALAERDADRAVDEVPDLRRLGRLLHEGAGDVLEHADEVDFLLVVAADGVARLLPRDREHRHVVETGVVEAR